MASRPTEDELRDRITSHLEFGEDRHSIALVWKGYLAGLYEWGMLDLDAYTRLGEKLPRQGNREVAELFQGEPLSPDAAKEIEAFIAEGEV